MCVYIYVCVCARAHVTINETIEMTTVGGLEVEKTYQ